MITLKKADFEKILAHAKKELPNEACGLIAGVKDGADKHIQKVYLLTEYRPFQRAFFSGSEGTARSHQGYACKRSGSTGQLAFSSGIAVRVPSQEDKRLAYDKTASYMILSLMELEQPVLNSFHIEGDDAEKEPLVIEE